MNPYLIHAADLADLQSEMKGDCPTVIWNATTIKTLPGGITLRSSNSSGGFQMESDFEFVCLAADFGTNLPSSNQKLFYQAEPLKIESVIIMPGGFQLRIKANHVAQGR